MTETWQLNGTKLRCEGPFREATSLTKKPKEIEFACLLR